MQYTEIYFPTQYGYRPEYVYQNGERLYRTNAAEDGLRIDSAGKIESGNRGIHDGFQFAKFAPDSKVIFSGDGRGNSLPIEQINDLAAVAQAHTARIAPALELWGKMATAKIVYIRAGKIPASGYSHNYRDGYGEAGVSVYKGWQISNHIYLDMRGMDAISSIHILSGGRTVYYATGEVLAATGSDGEALLEDAVQGKKVSSKITYSFLLEVESPYFADLAAEKRDF
jgi:hypothetical protein